MMRLTASHREMITELVRAGHGSLDTMGRVCVGPLRQPLPGDAVAWLALLTHGLIAGEDGNILPTASAREWVANRIDGIVRESQ